ncbi:hypothetical protein [Peribacillus acanthi]|uniref:hypothetical protein n=1 Tax=Peribacillus acanthi TaxID=2171554 RepID=UPI0013008650|nr:hypothetical protein [Peribacillus acanthi]
MMDEEKRVEVERKENPNSGLVGATLIKYLSYIIIFFGIIWFLIQYILPRF